MLSRYSSTLRGVSAVAASVLVAGFLIALTAASAGATVFPNAGAITIPTGPGQSTPYPSTISVSGLTGTIVDVNATLTGITHTYPDDIDILLVGPAGQKVVLMADTGGSTDITGVTLTFDDSAASSLPDATTISSGTYKPTIGATAGGFPDTVGFDGTAPAPSGPYSAALSAFNATAPNGTWSLFVYDDSAGDSGSISGGWSLDITTNAPTITSFTPTSGGAGTSVVITGTNFTGATAVTFGGAAATTFTVNSPTQITATVPQAAVTGPIAVTTPIGTGTSTTSFSVIKVTSFAPSSGKVGTSVVITGTLFTSATAVKFNGTSATSFTVNSATQITAAVPAGATTGPISVTSPIGTATSTAKFVVKHARTVTLTIGKKAVGGVSVNDGFAACASHVPVKLQHLQNGNWRTVGSATTTASGNYSIGLGNASGKYRALAPGRRLVSGDKCLKDVSPVVKS